MVILDTDHGVNPSIYSCFYCGKDAGLIFVGKQTKAFKDAGVLVKDDNKMPMHVGVINMEPCDKCKGYMRQGIVLISVKDGDDEKENPYRTGNWIVVKESVIDKMISDEDLIKQIKHMRFCFVPDKAWAMFGFPTAKEKEINHAVLYN